MAAPVVVKHPSIDLSIYLLKRGRDDVESVIDATGLQLISIGLGADVEAELYIQKPRPQPPKWARLFEGQVDLREFGRGASPGAILFLHLDGRLFAIPFGIGRHLIDREAVEERFGLLSVLNSIPSDRVRSIDKTSFDARGTQSHVQASREASPEDFGLDVERDLVRAVTGTPTDEDVGLRLHGMDALRATVRLTLEGLPDRLRDYLKRSRSKAYKKHFPWIDHIAAIKDSELIVKLDEKMIEHIQAQNYDKCWMAVPELIDWSQYIRFRYGGRKKNLLHHDIGLREWIAELNEMEGGFAAENIDLQRLQRTTVRCVNEDEVETQRWVAYKCIYAEVDHGGKSYLLSNGQWYRVDQDLVSQVNEFYAAIDKYEQDLPEFNDTSETVYNQRVHAESNGTMALMDAKSISYGGGPSRIEFCDLYTTDRDLIHVKRYSQSSGLSHLFSQGTVSGELFKTQPAFRALVTDLLPDTHKLADSTATPQPDEYRVVFAVVSKELGEDLTLPFFSRLNLRAAATRLRGFGYRIALKKIGVNHELSVTKKVVG